MISETVHKVAGTYIPPSRVGYTRTLSWIKQECLEGRFASSIQEFCMAQVEMLDPKRVELRRVSDEAIHCVIPCCVSDHESNRTFIHEVRFDLDPETGKCRRQDEI